MIERKKDLTLSNNRRIQTKNTNYADATIVIVLQKKKPMKNI